MIKCLLFVSASGLPWSLVAQPAPGNGIVAEVDSKKVLHEVIACDPGQVNRPDCHAIEQSRLSRRIHQHWITTAVRSYGVKLTPAEEADAARRTAADEPHIQAAAARFQALAVAALKIRRGADRAETAAELATKHISAAELEWELRHLPTIQAAERTAAKDFVAEGRAAAMDSHTRPYLLKHLGEIVTARAGREQISFDSAEERFWSEIAMETHTRILDPAFEMPAKKGILVNR